MPSRNAARSGNASSGVSGDTQRRAQSASVCEQLLRQCSPQSRARTTPQGQGAQRRPPPARRACCRQLGERHGLIPGAIEHEQLANTELLEGVARGPRRALPQPTPERRPSWRSTILQVVVEEPVDAQPVSIIGSQLSIGLHLLNRVGMGVRSRVGWLKMTSRSDSTVSVLSEPMACRLDSCETWHELLLSPNRRQRRWQHRQHRLRVLGYLTPINETAPLAPGRRCGSLARRMLRGLQRCKIVRWHVAQRTTPVVSPPPSSRRSLLRNPWRPTGVRHWRETTLSTRLILPARPVATATNGISSPTPSA